MRVMLRVLAACLMLLSFCCARDACAMVGFPPDYAFGRLAIVDGGDTVLLHHPNSQNARPQHLRLGLSNYKIVDAWWERDGSTAKIMIHVIDKNNSSERDMLLGQAYIG